MGVDKDLRVLRSYEECYLWRKRNKVSQAMFADLYFTNEDTVSKFERGAEEAFKNTVEPWKGFRPLLGELCRIARRRTGKNMDALKESHQTTIKRERHNKGDLLKLKRFWEKKGFLFPVL